LEVEQDEVMFDRQELYTVSGFQVVHEDCLRVGCQDPSVRSRSWCLTAYISFKDWMSSLVEAILALISSKTTTTFCRLVMVVDVGAIFLRPGGRCVGGR
jgi:hypothetical protein